MQPLSPSASGGVVLSNLEALVNPSCRGDAEKILGARGSPIAYMCPEPRRCIPLDSWLIQTALGACQRERFRGDQVGTSIDRRSDFKRPLLRLSSFRKKNLEKSHPLSLCPSISLSISLSPPPRNTHILHTPDPPKLRRHFFATPRGSTLCYWAPGESICMLGVFWVPCPTYVKQLGRLMKKKRAFFFLQASRNIFSHHRQQSFFFLRNESLLTPPR